ncbi:MAG: hypothetical protein EPO21_03765 [Chloroflexota bacterium]|nr:MAG: hypothetical protein EPO21_03765 [Chloroflexota bacterium]
MEALPTPKGISERNRQLLATLHRKARGPFTVREAAGVLSLGVAQTHRFLAYLAARGWLVRTRRGLYGTVPLDAVEPAQWREDPWVVASKVFGPSFYIAGWSACEHWGLTDQLFRETVVVTRRRLRRRVIEIQGFSYHAKSVAEHKIFGTRTVWRDQIKVQVSDPTRTVVDILDDPSIGGGIRYVAEVLAAYLRSDHRSDVLLAEYAHRVGNRTIFKRLGYLLESLGIAAPELIEICKNAMSSGVSLLDPTLGDEGHVLRRWNLRLNAVLGSEGAER